MTSGDEPKDTNKPKSISLDELLEQRERLEEILQKKFTRVITVMFTDMKGSTALAATQGDVVSRVMIKKHNEIVLPLIEKNKGVLVKTMGDGTLSYFENPEAAVRAAIEIQTGIDEYNRTKKPSTPILVRIGMNTGTGIVEKNDIFGDVVNVASRFESSAEPTEICISENTYDSLPDKKEFYCQCIKTAPLKGKEGFFKIFKVFWKQEEIEQDKKGRDISVKMFDSGVKEPESPEETLKSALAAAGPEEAMALQMAMNFEKNNEIIELYLLCQQSQRMGGIDAIYQNLENRLKGHEKINTKLNGKEAIWFFRETITAGRLPEADFPITNKAISRVPIKIGIRNGEGFLKIESDGKGQIKQVELEKPDERKTIESGIEYALGKHGKIIFSVCFPIKYDVYMDRFLTLEILNPEDCMRKNFNFSLRDVWENYELESGKMAVIGK